jgi:hypothetical protein
MTVWYCAGEPITSLIVLPLVMKLVYGLEAGGKVEVEVTVAYEPGTPMISVTTFVLLAETKLVYGLSFGPRVVVFVTV